MTFENADIVAVLKALSEIWGKPIATHPDLTGTITVLAARDVTVAESFEIMRSALNVRGFTMVGSLDDDSKMIEIWPRREMVNRGGAVVVGRDPQTVDPNQQIITQVVPLRFIRAKTVADTLQRLVNKDNANIVAIDDTNTLVITDRAENIKRLLEIIKAIDDVPQERRTLEVIALQYANATDVQQLLINIYSDPLGALNRQMRGGQNDPRVQQQVMMLMQAGALDPTQGVRITADSRTNSLVLYGPPEVLEALRPIVKQLDRNITQQVIFRKYKLRYADASTLAQSLNLLFQQPQGAAQQTPIFFRRMQGADNGRPGFASLKENLVVADSRTNSLLVTATPDNMRIFEDLIQQMDQPGEMHQVVEVIPLEFATATNVARSLQQLLRGSTSGNQGFFFFLFGGQRSTDGPLDRLKDVTVVASTEQNTLIVTGPPEALPAVRKMVGALDQPRAQVYINVIIADVTLNNEQNLGVELSWLSAPGKNGQATTGFNLDNNVPQGVRYALVTSEFSALLKALSNRTKVKVLSTPHITTVDNTQAQISIGTQYPFPKTSESSAGTVQTTFDFKDISIKLMVTPHVSLGSQMVNLDVDQTIDELTGTIQQGGSTVPLIATRRAVTKVMVETGQTIVIGGIIRTRTERQEDGVPLLQDIPLLGSLFRRTKDRTERTELMVFLTPFAVTTDEQLKRIKEYRQRELTRHFPQVDEFLRGQSDFGEKELPTPAPKAPEPQPKPKPEPVPHASLPERPRRALQGPPAPVATRPRPVLLGPAAPRAVRLGPLPQ